MVSKEELAAMVLNQWKDDNFTSPDNPDAMDVYAEVLGTTGEGFKEEYMKKQIRKLKSDISYP